MAAEPEWTAALPDGAGLVVLDGTVTPELEAEGWAKDRIRELQDLRKSTGLDVSDRIRVASRCPRTRRSGRTRTRELIAGEILATSFEFGEPVDGSRDRRRRAGGDRQGLKLLRRVDVVDPLDVLGIGFDVGQVEIDDDRFLVAADHDA